MFDSEGCNLDAIVLCGEGEEKLEGIAVRLNGIVAHAPDVKEILVEELMDARGEFHIFFHCCQRVKSNRFLRLFALATLR